MRTIPHPAVLAGTPLHAQQLTDALRKRLSNCTAHLAWFYGATLVPIESDDGSLELVATFGSITRRFRSVPEVEGWIAALDALDAPRHEVARFVGTLECAA